MTQFDELNLKIRSLLDAQVLGKLHAGLIQADFTANEVASTFDIRDFKAQMQEMRQTAVIITSFSGLYASVIKEVVIPGFSKATLLSKGNPLVDSTKEISQLVEEKFQAMDGYLQESDSKCRVLATKSMDVMKNELRRVERVGNE
jgi:hypothetical protein